MRRWKVPRVCDGCGCGRSGRDWFLLCVLQQVVVPVVSFYAFPEAVVADRIGMAAWMLHGNGLCFGEEAGARNLVFFRVKWLQATIKGTSCVRRVRLRSFRTRLVPSMCFATSGCSCGVVVCVSWSCGCRSHCNGCMNVAWSMFWGGSRSTKPCVLPCLSHGCRRRWKVPRVCDGCGCGRSGRDWFLLCVLQQVVIPVV